MGPLRALGATVALLALLAGCGAPQTSPRASGPSSAVTATAPTPPAVPLVAETLWIPRIDAGSPLIVTGLQSDGSVAVPAEDEPEQASYYEFGPVPGQVGPALVLGHVNGPDDAGTPGGAPGVFARLHELVAGDEVLIGVEGATLRFLVYDTRVVDKDAFPWDEVIAPVPVPELRLITCTGAVVGGSYTDNLVVSARLV